MGNKTTKGTTVNCDSVDGVYIQKRDDLYQNLDGGLSGRSFASVSSHQSTYSVSRPWSRVSRRRWKESTLTLQYQSSKTAWPVSQLESFFLPEFPVTEATNRKEFEILEEINKGAFGKVYKARKVDEPNGFYALKVLSKSKIIRDNSVRQVKEEVQIQRVCGHHSFIVNCPSHWQSRKRLYIVSDFVAGGELFGLLKAFPVLPVVLVRLLVAQLALAIDFLHNAGVIYRDLKPENVLLDDDGNVQLIDFGLSKWLSYGKRTRTICGTLLYMAPEVMASSDGYGHAVDWWSLGVVACLMLTGKYPSTTGPDSALPANNKRVKLPQNVQLDVPSRDLLLRLLEIDPAKRLRSLRMLQTIAFYKDFNFDDVKEKKVKPNDLLKGCFPNDPPDHEQEFYDAEGFDETFPITL